MDRKRIFSALHVAIIQTALSFFGSAQSAEFKPDAEIFVPNSLGVLMFEAENTAMPNGWQLGKAFPGYSGAGYAAWKGKIYRGAGSGNPRPNFPVIRLDRCPGAVVRGSRATTGTGVFLSAAPGELKRIFLEGNILGAAAKPTEENAKYFWRSVLNAYPSGRYK